MLTLNRPGFAVTAVSALVFSACGPAGMSDDERTKPPTNNTTQQVISDPQRVKESLRVAAEVRDAIELLGLLPDYTCGDSRSTFLGRAVGNVSIEVACVTVTTESEATADVVRLRFSDQCRAKGHVVSGDAVVRVSGGEDRLEIEAELQGLNVDGRVLTGKAGYGTCGDEKRYWGAASGTLEDGTQYRVDMRVGVRQGLPVIGGTTLILDGSAELRRGDLVDGVQFTGLEYEVGEHTPKSGTIEVFTHDMHTVKFTFSPLLWKLNQVTVQHDGGAEATSPVP
ncbi:MAG: hypothetical protein JNM17_16025 [Archangium sp.]|nr:hypothetical protein [Archangium sp.]